jgi:hypothetical protein
VTRLNRLLDHERQEFHAVRAALRKTFAPLNAPPDIDERLVAYADEFGSDSAVLMLKRSPKVFEIPGKVPPKVVDAAAPTVEKLVLLNRTMAGLVVQRENILVAENPNHDRVYMDMGREFRIAVLDGQFLEQSDTGERTAVPLAKEDGARAKQLRQAWDQERQEHVQEDGQDQEQGQDQ